MPPHIFNPDDRGYRIEESGFGKYNCPVHKDKEWKTKWKLVFQHNSQQTSSQNICIGCLMDLLKVVSDVLYEEGVK